MPISNFLCNPCIKKTNQIYSQTLFPPPGRLYQICRLQFCSRPRHSTPAALSRESSLIFHPQPFISPTWTLKQSGSRWKSWRRLRNWGCRRFDKLSANNALSAESINFVGCMCEWKNEGGKMFYVVKSVWTKMIKMHECIKKFLSTNKITGCS